MLDRDVREVADRRWAREFACQPDDLRPEATHVQEHAGPLVGASRIWILVVGACPLVSLPRTAMDVLASRARGWSRSLVADAATLSAAVRPLEVEKIVGPAFIGYGTADTLELSLAPGGREVTPLDAAAVARLRATCSDEAWAHGGSDPLAVPSFGCFNDRGTLLALAGYKTWDRKIAHLSIVSAPSQRGRGFASTAVACAAKHALDAGLVAQYRTLASNAPSMGVARRLGFERYGFSVSVRLVRD